METTDLLLYGLLALIALLLAIAILILLRRNSSNQRTELPTPTTSGNEQAQIAAERPTPQEQPEPDPLEKYLQHLDVVCQSVQPMRDNEYAVRLSAWSLSYTLEVASSTRYYDEPEDYRPILRLYFTRQGDGSWEVSDRGETTSTLVQVSDNAEAEIEACRRQIDKTTITLAPDGTLISHGENYLTFEQALLDMQETAEAMDYRWTPQVWGKVGLMTQTVEQANGQRHEFTGKGSGWLRLPALESTRSFALRSGAVAIHFEHTAKSSSKDKPGEVHLVRDNPGAFDRKTLLCEFVGSHAMTDVWLVTEGRWRDPHPDIDYHLEVMAHGEWNCTILQPELGQSKGTFPHRAGLTNGAIIMGPFRTGPRPVRAQIRHEGSGQFQLQFTSLDGTHQPDVFTAEGQCHVEDHETELLPGKEYIASAYGSGPWEIQLTEGY